MLKTVSKLDFFRFLESQNILREVKSFTKYSDVSGKYFTTFYYIDCELNVVNLCYQDFDVFANSVDYLLEEDVK